MLRGILRVFSFRGTEWVYYSLAFAVAAIAATGLLWNKAKPKENPAGLKQIGTLEASGSEVKRKFFSDIDFQETASKDNVYLKDTLFVGPNSKVNLALGEYGDFELSPNSILLVYLDFEAKNGEANPATESTTVGQSLKLKLTQGEIKYKKPKSASKAVGSDEPVKTVAVEIADNTFLKLDGQEELKVERTKAGEITVHEATVAPIVEKIPEPVAIPVVIKPGEVTPAATMPPEPEHFELKVGESFIESEIKLHANLIQEFKSPVKLEESVPANPSESLSLELAKTENKETAVVAKKQSITRQIAASSSNEEPVNKESPIESTLATAPSEVVITPPPPPPSVTTYKPSQRGFFLGPLSYELVSLSATDTSNRNITTVSNYVLGVGVGYGFEISESSQLNIESKIKRYQFQNVSTVTISDSNSTTFALKAVYQKQIAQNFVLSASAGAEEILNLEPKSSTQVNLSNLICPEVGVGASYHFGDNSKWFKAFEIKASVDALLPAKADSYTSKLGHKEELKILSVKDLEESLVQGGVTAYQQKFSSPFGTTTQFGVGIEFTISLGSAGKKRTESDLEIKESEGAK